MKKQLKSVLAVALAAALTSPAMAAAAAGDVPSSKSTSAPA